MPESPDKPTTRELEIEVRGNEKLTLLAIQELEKRLEDRFAASQAAITKAETAANKEFDAANNVKAELGNLVRGMLSRSEADQRDQSIRDVCEALRRDLTTVKEDARNQLFMTKDDLQKKIDSLLTSRDTNTGKSQGVGQFWGVLLAIISVAGLVVGLILKK